MARPGPKLSSHTFPPRPRSFNTRRACVCVFFGGGISLLKNRSPGPTDPSYKWTRVKLISATKSQPIPRGLLYTLRSDRSTMVDGSRRASHLYSTSVLSTSVLPPHAPLVGVHLPRRGRRMAISSHVGGTAWDGPQRTHPQAPLHCKPWHHCMPVSLLCRQMLSAGAVGQATLIHESRDVCCRNVCHCHVHE